MKKKIDWYRKSQRKKQTQKCIVFARNYAVRCLGPRAWHQCDSTCDHEGTCEDCKFYLQSDEDPLGVPDMTCTHPRA